MGYPLCMYYFNAYSHCECFLLCFSNKICKYINIKIVKVMRISIKVYLAFMVVWLENCLDVQLQDRFFIRVDLVEKFHPRHNPRQRPRCLSDGWGNISMGFPRDERLFSIRGTYHRVHAETCTHLGALWYVTRFHVCNPFNHCENFRFHFCELSRVCAGLETDHRPQINLVGVRRQRVLTYHS